MKSLTTLIWTRRNEIVGLLYSMVHISVGNFHYQSAVTVSQPQLKVIIEEEFLLSGNNTVIYE